MPIEILTRPWNTRPPGEPASNTELALVAPTAPHIGTNAEIAQALQAHYFAAPDDGRVPIALSVNGSSADVLVGAETPPGERGAALLSALNTTFRRALRHDGLRSDIAYVQARDLVNLLACTTFIDAYKTLVTPEDTHVPHQLFIAVATENNSVSVHTTAWYRDNERPPFDPRPAQIVDLAVTFYSEPSFFGGRARLEAEVTRATVLLPRQLNPLKLQELIGATKERLGVPDGVQDAPRGCWERLKQLLCRLLGERGIRFLVGTVNEITAGQLPERPQDIVIYEDPRSWIVSAQHTVRHPRYPVASYSADGGLYGGLYIVRRNGTRVEAETQEETTEHCARIGAANRARFLREEGYLEMGLPWFGWWCTPSIGQRTSPRSSALSPDTYPPGNAQIRQLTEDGAQHDAVRREAVYTTLNSALFPAPDTQALVITVDGADIATPHLQRACAALRALEQRAPAPEALAGHLRAWMLDYDIQVPRPVEADNAPDPAPLAPDIAAAKSALFDHLIGRITQALPADMALQRQVLATLARAEGAMHRVCQINGLPRFENDLEERRLSLVTHRSNRHLRAGTVNIAFNSWHHALSRERAHDEAGGARQSGRVIFGDAPGLIFPERLLSAARLLAKAAYRVTHEAAELTSVQYEGELELRAANDQQPGQ